MPCVGIMAPSFPARLAAIDIGSNAIRMLAAEFTDAMTYRTLELHRDDKGLSLAVALSVTKAATY